MLNECHFNNRISNYLLPLILFLVLPLFVYYMYILKIFIFLLTYITSQADVFVSFFSFKYLFTLSHLKVPFGLSVSFLINSKGSNEVAQCGPIFYALYPRHVIFGILALNDV